MTDWPNDADGDVLRRMARHGFDFGQPWLIDFNVVFESWPPPPEAIARLQRDFPSTVVNGPDEHGASYAQFQVFEEVSYTLVMRIQAEVSALMAPYGGVCESWGVLH